MAILHECVNKKAAAVVEPYLGGMSVTEINLLYEKLEDWTYTDLIDFANETNNRRLVTIIDICGEQLRDCMR